MFGCGARICEERAAGSREEVQMREQAWAAGTNVGKGGGGADWHGTRMEGGGMSVERNRNGVKTALRGWRRRRVTLNG